jgi:hypothetical protein
MTTLAVLLAVMVLIACYRRLEGHPFLRTWLVCGVLVGTVAAISYLLGRDDPANPITIPSAALMTAYFSFMFAGLIRGVVKLFGWDNPYRTGGYEPTYDRHGRLSSNPNYGKPGPDWNPDYKSQG